MSKIKLFLILSGYQITWLACVFGERFYQEPLIGFFCGLAFIIVYIINVNDYKRFFLIVLLISLPGYFFDSIIVYFKIYEFNSDIVIGFLPIWMIVLWLSFATLFYEVFIFLKNYQIIGISLSTFLGPLTYYSGEIIGIIKIYEIKLFLFFMIIFWFLLMIFYLKLILKKIDYSAT